MQIAILATVLLLGLAVLGAWLSRVVRGQLSGLRTDSGSQLADRNADMDRRLQGLQELLNQRLAELDTKVAGHLGAATKSSNELHERLGKLDQATGEVLARAKDLGRLEQALRPPKARGGFGELLLERMLADQLPRDAYSTQYGFRGGERVDAVIRVERLVPVDSKFPLENFERVVASSGEEDQLLHEKAFARDVKIHIDAIAQKYIRPDEGTYDFALMYLPAEAVYYELVCGKTGALYEYALERRVFPVSPTTFTAYLQVIALGLKGMQIEQRAHEVMAYCAQLRNDFGRFRQDFELVGTHLGRAQSKYGEAERRLDRFDTKLERATDAQPDALPAPEPAALPLGELDAA
ncbi:MAG: recombination protein RmuC [Gaiellaceae bacterium]|jgi:DNA recombination protein RmuC|nr:recombination protein RmuC [Gaiellaceae bacterium]